MNAVNLDSHGVSRRLSAFICFGLEHADKRKRSIVLCKVHTISNDKLVWAFKSDVVNVHFHRAPSLLVKDAADPTQCERRQLPLEQ